MNNFFRIRHHLLALPLLLPLLAQAQGSVGIGIAIPNSSAALDVSSTSKGLLPPRMTTTQRDAIANPAAGLTIFNTSTGQLNTYDGTKWTANVTNTAPVTFSYTGGVQTYTVPAGVTAINVDMAGAAGGASGGAANDGGLGGRVQSTISVTPNQVLSIYVGGSGSTRGSGGSSYNGGGASPVGTGGGGTDIRIGGTALSNRVLVAGGGGGAGGRSIIGGSGVPGPPGAGGAGGGPEGADGTNGGAGSKGLGATQAAGGAGGSGYIGGYAGSAGTSGQGGSGSGSLNNGGGGGGGGGYYGGGAGGGSSGGGGGSSYAASAAIFTLGYQSGNGYVRLSTLDDNNAMNFIRNQFSPQAGATFNVGGSGAVGTGFVVDANGANDGSIAISPLLFGGYNSGEGISSQRTSGDNQYGLDFYTAGANRLAISVNGNVGIGTTTPATRLDLNGNLRLAVRVCPVNTSSYTLAGSDLAYSIFKVQDNAFANTITLPPASAGQVEGQQITIMTVATSGFTISANNTDGSVSMASIGSGGNHGALFTWLIDTNGNGRWIRTQ